MPIYEYKCKNGHKFDAFLKVSDYSKEQHCDCCGEIGVKQLSLPMVHVDIPAYQSPSSGKWITSRTERREDLKRTNCVEYEPSMVQEVEKKRKVEDRELDKKIDEHVETTISKMSTREQEQLGSELESLDIEITKA